ECTEHHCSSFKVKLDACTERVEGNPETEETCVEEFFDLMVNMRWPLSQTYSDRFLPFNPISTPEHGSLYCYPVTALLSLYAGSTR
ncbi:hypothetical protein BJ742DRAFT_676876, partial [Cladochytrium replicatum]